MKAYYYILQRNFKWRLPSGYRFDSFKNAVLAAMQQAILHQNDHPDEEVDIIIYEVVNPLHHVCVLHESVNNVLSHINLDNLYNPES